ncbi:MAG: prolipoprotein diacylglyceryl transferase [Coriobacteriales bacterium]
MLNSIYQGLDPIAFAIGPFAVRWYGIAYILGFVCAGLVIWRTAKRWKIAFDGYDVLTLVCFVAFGIIIGGRLGYCLFYGDGYYLTHPLEILAVSKGGMSFHGGLVGALLGCVVFSATQRMPLLSLGDLVVCGAPLGLFFGRCANFVNGELYGAPTQAPWGVDFTGTGVFFHPSQLYEALLEGLLIFAVLNLLARKVPPRPRGFFTGLFLVMYGCLRILIEFVRLPDAQLGYFFGTWGTMGQLLSLPMVLIGLWVLIRALVKKNPQVGIVGRAQE